MRADSDGMKGDAARFLAAGVVNTLLTSAIYFVCLIFMNPSASYAAAWVVGIVFVAVVYPDRVFTDGRNALRDRIAIALVNVAVFAAGIAVLWTATGFIGDARMAFVVTLLVTTLLNFILARTYLRRPV